MTTTTKQFETKAFWHYAFPLWDGKRTESIIGVSLHYMAMLIFIPLSIYHNLKAIEHLEGLPYVWLFGLVLIMDFVITILLGVIYEFILSFRLVSSDGELRKAFGDNFAPKNYLLGSFRKSGIILGIILLLLIAGTVFLSLQGGFIHAEKQASTQYKPAFLTEKRTKMAEKHREETQRWASYYDEQIAKAAATIAKHKEEVTYKGRINIANKATQKVVGTHTESIALHQKAKAEKLAFLDDEYQAQLRHAEEEHYAATQHYQAKMDQHINFTETYVWAFSILNIVFVLVSLLLNQESMEKGLYNHLAFRMKEYFDSRKVVLTEAQDIRKETVRLEKQNLDSEAKFLKEQLNEKEELEEAKQIVEVLSRLNEEADKLPISLTHETVLEINELFAKYRNKGGGSSPASPQATAEKPENDTEVAELPTSENLGTQEDFFVGDEVDLSVENALEKLRKLEAENSAAKPENLEAEKPENGIFAGENRKDPKISPPENDKPIRAKKTLSEYEKSHPLMVKYCRKIAAENFPYGSIRKIQEGMVQDENYQGESVSTATISSIIKLLKHD